MADSSQQFFFLDLWTADKIEGGCKKKPHEHWLELDDWDFSMHQVIDANKKEGTPGATSAMGSFGFSITHNGPHLFQLAAATQFHQGASMACTFESERGGLSDGTTGVFFRLVFTDWYLKGRHLSGDDSQKSEHVEIIFDNVQVTYRELKNGILGPPVPMAYSVVTNSVTS